MADFIAWSHSRRKMFNECPKQFYHMSVPKRGHPDRVEYVQSKAAKDGDAIDTAITARIQQGTPLPPQFACYEGMVAAVLAAPGTKFAQLDLALDQAFQPCGSMDWNRCWLRARIDVAVMNLPHAFFGDWKNGSIWLDEDQLKLFAAVGFHTYPEIEVIDTSYVWLKHGVTSDHRYHRRELPDLWAELLPDVERLQAAYKANHWPAEPKRGAKTCAYCPVNRAGKCPMAAGPFKGD